MNLLKSFRKWVRKYMSSLEEKESLSFLDILLSSIFRLIAKILKLFQKIIFSIQKAFDFKTNEDLKTVKDFLSKEKQIQLCFVYVSEIKDAEKCKKCNCSDCSKTILVVENTPSLQLISSQELMIPSKLLSKYFTEIKKLLVNRKGKICFLSVNIENIYLLPEFNSMNFESVYIDSSKSSDTDVSNFFKRNSSDNILEQKVR